MIESFLAVGQQVLILFLLVAAGFFCGRRHVFGETAVKGMTEVVLLFATPCVIIQSFIRPFEPSMLAGLGIAALVALGVHAVSIGLAHLIFRDREEGRRRVLRFATVFSNAGYMGLPLQQALLGETGVFYGATYIAVFNLVLWSYGLWSMGGEKGGLTVRKLVFNPGVVGLLIGLAIFLFSIPVPALIAAPVGYLAALNTPLPMLIVGFYLSQARFLDALRDKRSYVVIALRLVGIPLLTLLALLACGVRGTLLTACVIAAAAPVAAATTMFATKFDRDKQLSVNLVSLSTALSVLTMPLIVGAAQAFAA